MDRLEFGRAVHRLGLKARSGKPMAEAHIDAAFRVALRPQASSGDSLSPRTACLGGRGGRDREVSLVGRYASFEEACCSFVQCAVRGDLAADGLWATH
jgi:hypothetical protein